MNPCSEPLPDAKKMEGLHQLPPLPWIFSLKAKHKVEHNKND